MSDLKQQQGNDIKERVLDAQKRIVKVRTAAAAALDDLQVGLKALETDEAKANLTAHYRAKRAAELRAEALKKVGVDGDQALELASALKGQRGSITGKDAVLRSARFVTLLTLSDDPESYENQHSMQLNEQRLLRDELIRMRLRAELTDAPVEELAGFIAEAAAINDLAGLHVAAGVLRSRTKTESVEALTPALSAHIKALKTISLPAAAQELDEIFDAVDVTAHHLAEALHEIRTGREPQAPRSALERAAEVGGQQAAEERHAAKRVVKERALQYAPRLVQEAIRADESDAARLTIPIVHNEKPAA